MSSDLPLGCCSCGCCAMIGNAINRNARKLVNNCVEIVIAIVVLAPSV